MANKYMRIYLRDHLAAATAGVEFAQRCVRETDDGVIRGEFEDLARELEEERALLLDLMKRLEVEPSQGKIALTWLAEKAGRLKLNGEITKTSPLSRVLELEGLSAAVMAKLGLWRTLELVREFEPILKTIPIKDLIERAERQEARIIAMHRNAARTMYIADRAID